MKIYLFFEICKDVVEFKVTKLFEDFILSLNLGHEAIEVGMGEFREVRKLATVTI